MLTQRKSKFTSVSAEDKEEDSCNTFITELNTEPCEATTENESDINLVLRKLRNSLKVYLNINSIRNEFEMLQLLLADYIDFMMIFESKLYDTFPSSQFQIHGFRISHRLDRNYMADFNAEVSETSFSFFL